jgi:hypothetical protein
MQNATSCPTGLFLTIQHVRTGRLRITKRDSQNQAEMFNPALSKQNGSSEYLPRFQIYNLQMWFIFGIATNLPDTIPLYLLVFNMVRSVYTRIANYSHKKYLCMPLESIRVYFLNSCPCVAFDHSENFSYRINREVLTHYESQRHVFPFS